MWTVDCQRRLNSSLATEAKLDAIKKSISKRAASIVSSPLPSLLTPPHLLNYLHLQLIVATFKATQDESSQRQSRADRQAASQVGTDK